MSSRSQNAYMEALDIFEIESIRWPRHLLNTCYNASETLGQIINVKSLGAIEEGEIKT